MNTEEKILQVTQIIYDRLHVALYHHGVSNTQLAQILQVHPKSITRMLRNQTLTLAQFLQLEISLDTKLLSSALSTPNIDEVVTFSELQKNVENLQKNILKLLDNQHDKTQSEPS
ncbi:MAG: hypothetical protein M9892_07455 [Bacteroidetes bacterium]|nr:hypothetical protein [Bacteroidota bacterium]